MFKNRFTTIISGILATLVLGALANGIWESLFRPVLIWLRDLILTIGTLGIQSLIDGVYADVGKASYERGSLFFLIIFISLLTVADVFSIAKVIRLARGGNQTSPFLSRIRTARFRLLVALPVLVVCSIVLIFRVTAIIYATEASANLQRYEFIIAPYISPEERLLLKSRIAQLHTRAEFVEIIDDMKTVIKTNHLFDPAISIF